MGILHRLLSINESPASIEEPQTVSTSDWLRMQDRVVRYTSDNQQLLITRGIPGSGKSQFANAWVGSSENHARVNRDDLRAMLFAESGVLSADKEAAVSVAERAQVRALLKQGKSVVVDATHLKKQYARVWAEIAKEVGVHFAVIDFKIDVEEAVERDRIRGLAGERTVGEDVIRKLDKRFPSKRWPEVTARDTAPGPMVPYVPNESRPTAYVFDIDGTLAHHDGLRSPYDYENVHVDVVDDYVAILARELFAMGHTIIIVSGRKALCYEATVNWLNDNDIPFDKLLMRGAEDNRPDFQVKYEIFDQNLRDSYNVLGVFDDRNQVVDMWRALSVKCFQVQPGAF